MKEKLDILCQTFQINASELAKSLGVDASAISHLRSGRNNPRYDFLVKILRTYPTINPDWLLLDSDQVLRDGAVTPTKIASLPLPDDEEFHSPDGSSEDDESTLDSRISSEVSTDNRDASSSDNSRADVGEFPPLRLSGKRVERVIVLYADKSFESYTPTEK